MKLAADRFSTCDFLYRTDPTGPVKSGRVYSYESHDRLYDVIVLSPERNDWIIRTNGRSSEFTPIHAAIVEHFGLRGSRPNERRDEWNC